MEKLKLSRLISFFHVARLSSISKASEVVCRSQPAVTQQIKALEDEIGCKLFHRIGKRKLVPTQEGKRLQAFVRSFMDEMDCTLDDIRLIGGGEYGQVSICMIPSKPADAFPGPAYLSCREQRSLFRIWNF